MTDEIREPPLAKYLNNVLDLAMANSDELKSELATLGDEDFYIWRTFRLLAKNYSTVLKFSRSNVIDYSLKNILLIILKAFSNLPHSKIEALKDKLADVNIVRQQLAEPSETPAVESDQESGEVQINGKEERFKSSPKRPVLNKKPALDKSKHHSSRDNGREAERNDRESQSKSRPLRSERTDRNERSEYKSQAKSFNPGYKKHKYY